MNQSDLCGRLARWALKLQAFTFKIVHRKGSQNVVPDTLSRAFMDEIDTDLNPLHLNFDSTAFDADEYHQLVLKVQNNSSAYKNLKVQANKLYINRFHSHSDTCSDIPSWKLYVPTELTDQLVKLAHNPPSSAHLGIGKTLDRLQRFFYWPTMSKTVTDYIGNCQICKQSKAMNSTTQPLMGQQIIAVRPMQHLYMDFMGPYPRSTNGNSYLFIVLDLYSKYVFLKPMKQALASAVCNFLEKEIFSVFSVPETIMSDNGSQFVSLSLKSLLTKFGVTHMFTPKYSPQCNASERVNRSILASLRSYIKDDHRKWDQHIHEIVSALRNVNHSATRYSPHYLMFGQHLIGHGSEYKLLRELNSVSNGDIAIQNKSDRLSMAQQNVLSHLEKAYKRSAHTYNLRSRPREFQVGKTVFVRNFALSDAIKHYSAKLAPKFLKATIVRQIGNVAYELSSPEGKSIGIYHAKDIRE